MSLSKEELKLTLLIRHLPREFSEDDKLEFLQHFGAISVKTVCLGGRKNEVVFATFPSAPVAKAALQRLHQLEVLGSYLIVEYARNCSSILSDPGTSTSEKVEVRADEDKRQRLQDQFMRRLVSWSSKLNLNQPPPSHLCYQYPPPTPATLSNISRALSMYPRLYTQLLHLMNRMNLPPPFQDSYTQNPTSDQVTQTDVVWVYKSSSESEMESDEDQAQSLSLPSKRLHNRRNIKPMKRPRFIKPNVLPEHPLPSSVPLRPEEVFETTETGVPPKKIELRLTGTLQLEKEENYIGGHPQAGESVAVVTDSSGFGTIHPPPKPPESCRLEAESQPSILDDDGSTISPEQLAANRIPEKDLQVLPVFKNYLPGTPSCRLYVKNISRDASARDLHFVYRRYSKCFDDESDPNHCNMFDIRLMTEGKMRGQAFITLPNVKLAQQALTETNGFILKDKPLVVQFARSAPASKS